MNKFIYLIFFICSIACNEYIDYFETNYIEPIDYGFSEFIEIEMWSSDQQNCEIKVNLYENYIQKIFCAQCQRGSYINFKLETLQRKFFFKVYKVLNCPYGQNAKNYKKVCIPYIQLEDDVGEILVKITGPFDQQYCDLVASKIDIISKDLIIINQYDSQLNNKKITPYKFEINTKDPKDPNRGRECDLEECEFEIFFDSEKVGKFRKPRGNGMRIYYEINDYILDFEKGNTQKNLLKILDSSYAKIQILPNTLNKIMQSKTENKNEILNILFEKIKLKVFKVNKIGETEVTPENYGNSEYVYIEMWGSGCGSFYTQYTDWNGAYPSVIAQIIGKSSGSYMRIIVPTNLKHFTVTLQEPNKNVESIYGGGMNIKLVGVKREEIENECSNDVITKIHGEEIDVILGGAKNKKLNPKYDSYSPIPGTVWKEEIHHKGLILKKEEGIAGEDKSCRRNEILHFISKNCQRSWCCKDGDFERDVLSFRNSNHKEENFIEGIDYGAVYFYWL